MNWTYKMEKRNSFQNCIRKTGQKKVKQYQKNHLYAKVENGQQV